MKKIIFLFVLLSILSSCTNKGTFSVTGVVKGRKEKSIFIRRIDIDTPILIDSSKINKRGEFHFKIKASETDFYQIGFSASDFITLLTGPDEKIKLVFDGKTLFEKYSISGSPESEKLQNLDNTLNKTKSQLDSLSSLYSKSSKEPGFDVKGPLLEAEFTKLIQDQRRKNIEFIINNTKSLASIKALYQQINPETKVFYQQRDLQYFKIVTDSLKRYYPNSKQVQALSRDFEKEMNQMYTDRLIKITKDLPEAKLDPDLKTTDGKRIALSSLRQKYVLLTFWSVQSKDCVAENLQLKTFYKLFNKKGFEIYQINLDANESDWKTAVKFDELPWISTREDDPANPVNAVLFNVKTLPTNYLFDKQGQIIASNLHGKSLQLKLEQLLNK
jgi:peroxiredoxin